MNTWHVILIAFALLAIGFASVFRHHLRFLSRKAFAVDYLNKFRSLVQTCDHDFDGKLFYWLTHRASKIQAELGQFGLADYRPPAAAYMFRNYQLIVNMLPEIRSGLANAYQIGACEDSLVRYIGWLDDRLGDSLRELANPLIWLRSGVQCVLSLPAAVLCWLGVIGESSFASLSNSRAFKFVCGLVTLLASVATILGYVLGPKELADVIRRLLGRL